MKMKIKNKMVIVHIILSKGFVGSEKYVLDLVKYQKTKNNVFAIISKKNQTLNRLLKKEIKTFEISNFFKKFFINSLIKKINPDIVHTHLGDAIKNIQKSPKYKIISTMHMNYKPKDYKNSDAIIVSNNTQFREIKKNFNGRLFKSHLWVNIPKINISKSKIKKKLNISSKDIVFGSIGRFHHQKGFDIIIKAFQDLNLPNCTLVLIGNGHDKFVRLEKKNKNFRIIGHVDNVSNYYNIFDVGVFMSRWETFGYCLVEGMKFKLPIISSQHIGNKDWINKFKIFKINQGDEIQLKKYIKQLYKTKYTKKNYNLRMFDYKKNCSTITSIYKKLLIK